MLKISPPSNKIPRKIPRKRNQNVYFTTTVITKFGTNARVSVQKYRISSLKPSCMYTLWPAKTPLADPA